MLLAIQSSFKEEFPEYVGGKVPQFKTVANIIVCIAMHSWSSDTHICMLWCQLIPVHRFYMLGAPYNTYSS